LKLVETQLEPEKICINQVSITTESGVRYNEVSLCVVHSLLYPVIAMLRALDTDWLMYSKSMSL